MKRKIRSATLLLCLYQAAGSFAAGTVDVCDEASLLTAMVGGGLVQFNCDGTITLTGTLDLSSSTTLDASSNTVTLSGNQAVRIFEVQAGQELNLINLSLINGLGAGIDGTNNVAGTDGYGGAILNDGGTVRLADCTLSGNLAKGGKGGDELAGSAGKGGRSYGGAIYSTNGTIVATNTSFISNRVLGGKPGIGFGSLVGGSDSHGGAICAIGGLLSLRDCSFINNLSHAGEGSRLGGNNYNSGTAFGGAVYSDYGNLMIIGSRFSCNTSFVDRLSASLGGAIRHGRGSFTIDQSIFEQNQAFGGFGTVFAVMGGFPGGPAYGGAVYLIQSTGTVAHSTFAHNLARAGNRSVDMPPQGTGAGGAIFADAVDLGFTNNTIAFNTAMGGLGFSNLFRGEGNGAGMYISGSRAVISHSTFANNQSHIGENPPANHVGKGGAIHSLTSSVTYLYASILAHSAYASNVFGVVQDIGYNIISDSNLSFTNTGSLTSTDPVLGPLDEYGGPTPTMVLLSGSPAIDGGPVAVLPPYDQRGRDRPYNVTNDIGAFESSAPFVIRGTVYGAHTYEGFPVMTGSSNVFTDGNREYSFEGLVPGNYTITPGDTNYVNFPTNQIIAVGPDRLSVEFKVYRLATTVIEKDSSNELAVVFAGEIGYQINLQTSLNLRDWGTVNTFFLQTSRLTTVKIPTTNSISFYRNSIE